MRIGIVTPAIMYGEFIEYFDESSRKLLSSLPNNNNVPAPSIIARGFIENGHFVRLFTTGKQSFHFKSEKIEIIISSKKNLLTELLHFSELRKAYGLYSVIKMNYKDLDVIHAHWTYHTALSTFSFAKKIPVFCTVRDWTTTIIKYLPSVKEKRKLYRSIIDDRTPKAFKLILGYKSIATFASYILSLKPDVFWWSKKKINDYVFSNNHIYFIGNSPYTKELIEKRIGKEVPFIMNPIDEKQLISKERKKETSELKIVTIQSMLDKRKNASALIEAFHKVLEYKPDAELLFLYSFPIELLKIYPDYISWEQKGWLDNVTFICNVPHSEIFNYVDKCTLMVHPSLEESFGNTIIESMMRKTPILGGLKSGAIPYLLDFGNRGYLCNVSDSNDIANSIIYIYENQDEAILKSEKAYSWIKINNTLKAITNAHIKYFEKVKNNFIES